MSQIIVHRRHGLRLAEVKRRAEAIAGRLRDEYGGSYAWEGDTLRFRRTGASGELTVTRDSFEVRVEVSFLLAPLRSRIEHEIRAFCDEHFAEGETRDRRQSTRPPASRRATPSKSPRAT
jgi:putative polyhydroxyalkanoate system protein